MTAVDRSFWAGRRVLVTGHTGFKGAWMVMLLHRLGAKVAGYSLPGPVSSPDLFGAATLAELCDDRRGDIRDIAAFQAAIADIQPEILLHMAAQPIVREGIRSPIETFDVNIMGVAKVLEAARGAGSLRAAMIITSDKCYENREHVWPYRETDAMGGSDPYSASKGAAEIVASSYARTYFATGQARVASVRAGNVIGGGDWAADRLVPDLVRATLSQSTVSIRSPGSVRPWQHVLDPLAGYLVATQAVCGRTDWAGFDSWNFGPNPGEEFTVREVVDAFQGAWAGSPRVEFGDGGAHKEAGLLRVDNTKAKVELGWRPTLTNAGAVEASCEWYKAVADGADARAKGFEQIERILDV